MEPVKRLKEFVINSSNKPAQIIWSVFYVAKQVAKPLFNLSAATLLLYITVEVMPWVKEKYRQDAIAAQRPPEPKVLSEDRIIHPPQTQRLEMMYRAEPGLAWGGLFNLRWNDLPGTWWDVDGILSIKKLKFRDDGRLRVLDSEGHAKDMAWFTWKDVLVLKSKERTINIHVSLIGHNGLGAQVVVGHIESKDGPAKAQLVQVTGNLVPALDKEYDGP
jgi:hypothetical protein